MAYLGSNRAFHIYEGYEASLANGAELDSDWIDSTQYDKIQFAGSANLAGMTVIIESKTNMSQPALTTPVQYNDGTFYLFNIPLRQRYIRIRWVNTTGVTVSDASMELKGSIGSSDKLSVFPLNIQPSIFSQASLVQAVIRGLAPNGQYINTQVNEAGALLSADFGTEVARGLYPGYEIDTKFGRNKDIDSGDEDIWNGGNDYTGFNCIAAQKLEVSSDNGNDQGALVTSGIVTSGSNTILIDSSATFIADGVFVGDIVLNDSKGIHGFIHTIVSETEVHVYNMNSGVDTNDTGNLYRIVTPTSTGAAVVRLSGLLNDDFELQIPEYVILNGTGTVLTKNDYIRQSRGEIVCSGSSHTNEGEINVQQQTSGFITMVMPANAGQSAIACTTVPANCKYFIKRLAASIVRSAGNAGSAQMLFQTRERGGSWRTLRFPGISDSRDYIENLKGAIIIEPMSDIRWRCESTSDSNSQINAQFTFYKIDI